MQLGDRIYKLRTQKNMSQGELADALEVSRQSVSKWETNSSVPELDKLVKLSELFGVSLDELVLDKGQPEQSVEQEPKVIYEERSKSKSTQKIAGIVLLCFAALLWLMIALFGDIIAGLVLAAPFVFCGLICLLVRKYAGLWCAWVVYLFVDIFLRFASGLNWQFIFLPQAYAGGLMLQLVVAWTLLGIFAALTVTTALRTRKAFPGSFRNNLIGTVSGWIVYVITWFIFAIPAYEAQNAVSYSQSYRYISAVSGWVRHIVLIVTVVFAVRLIASLLENWRRK